MDSERSILDSAGLRVDVYLWIERQNQAMTQLDVVYRYGTAPQEAEMQALDAIREVYGIRRITMNEKERTIRVEFDASRMKDDAIAALLRRAGMDVLEKLTLA